MKKILCLLASVALLGIIGCAKKAPEDAAKRYVKEMIAKHQGFDMDTSKLNYKVVEETKDSAKIEISGAIEVKAEMALVKRGGEWILEPAGKTAEKVPAPAPAVAAAKVAHEPAPKLAHEPAPTATPEPAHKTAAEPAAKAAHEPAHGEAQPAAHK